MMRSNLLSGTLYLLFALLVISGCSGPVSTPREVISDEVQTELNNLLEAWYPLIVDSLNGGYWTNLEYDWTISPDQVKMLVTQARGLWTSARAAEIFPENQILREAADHGFNFLTNQMWDTVHGGFHQYVRLPYDTVQYPAHKMIYGNAFALYALSQYAKINPAQHVVDWVKRTFDWMERTAHDPEHGGYFNLITPDSKSFKSPDFYASAVSDAGWGRPSWKDQNSSIHLLEALTTTIQVYKDALVRERLSEMLILVRDTMVRSSGSLHLYFETDWTPISHADSSRSFILENQNLDHISFGHDIETAYLLIDASRMLHGSPDEKTMRVAKQMVDHTLQHGFEPDFIGMFDRGYLFKGTDSIEVINRERIWWAEAEAWHTLVLMSNLYKDETIYETAAQNMWEYISTYQIDQIHGGWYAKGIDLNPESQSARKGHQWKGCYHDGRSLLQVYLYHQGKGL